MSFTWQNGRQLQGITKGTNNYSYTYDADGLRTSKTVNGVTTNYYTIEGTLLAETKGNDTIRYLQDNNGKHYGFIYNGTMYYYTFNLQGDVTGILDSSGVKVVEYTYDIWGKVLSVTGTLASTIGQINPIRYRGYYYDSETGFYYLQSRYYDPEVGRFLNADGYVSTGQGVLGNNIFAYCGNNPICNVDFIGERYCAATSVSKESSYDRFISCSWQNSVVLEKHNPAPIGQTSTGNVYIVPKEEDVKVTFPGDVVIIDNRNNYYDPSVQIRFSAKITNVDLQLEILNILNQYEEINPSPWRRNLDINDMMVEWDAHNDVYGFYANNRCLHVDLNNKDMYVPYEAYWWRAVYETIS